MPLSSSRDDLQTKQLNTVHKCQRLRPTVIHFHRFQVISRPSFLTPIRETTHGRMKWGAPSHHTQHVLFKETTYCMQVITHVDVQISSMLQTKRTRISIPSKVTSTCTVYLQCLFGMVSVSPIPILFSFEDQAEIIRGHLSRLFKPESRLISSNLHVLNITNTPQRIPCL